MTQLGYESRQCDPKAGGLELQEESRKLVKEGIKTGGKSAKSLAAEKAELVGRKEGKEVRK